MGNAHFTGTRSTFETHREVGALTEVATSPRNVLPMVVRSVALPANCENGYTITTEAVTGVSVLSANTKHALAEACSSRKYGATHTLDREVRLKNTQKHNKEQKQEAEASQIMRRTAGQRRAS